MTPAVSDVPTSVRPSTSASPSRAAQLLAQLYAPIAADLARAEEVLRDELRSHVDFVEELVGRVQLYRGKRLRPALLLLVAKACGNLTPDHHVLAAVVEMIHAATLVHDDILDDADSRRHVTTVNAEWGDEASVLLGDYLFTHSFHLAASMESTFACRMIGKATNLVCEGELHQVSRRGSFDLSEDEYLDIVTGKTAELIGCACRLGAHFAKVTPQVEMAMHSYGRALGVAFQIADDLLDLVADQSTTGKTTGSDLKKQKLTLPLIRLRETAPPSVVERARVLFAQPSVASAEELAGLLRESDGLAYAERRARQFADVALRQLELLPPSIARECLASLPHFAVERVS